MSQESSNLMIWLGRQSLISLLIKVTQEHDLIILPNQKILINFKSTYLFMTFQDVWLKSGIYAQTFSKNLISQ